MWLFLINSGVVKCKTTASVASLTPYFVPILKMCNGVSVKFTTTFLSSVSSLFGVDSLSLSFSCPIILISGLPNRSFVSTNDIVPLIAERNISSYIFTSAINLDMSSSNPPTVHNVHSSNWNSPAYCISAILFSQ